MKPLIVLLIVFVVAASLIKLTRGQYNFALAGRFAMAAMLLFTAIGHFTFTKGMAMMLPSFIPLKTQVIYITGVLEIVAAITLLIPALTISTGWFLVLFFIFLLPANIYAAVHHVAYQTGNLDGPGPEYLWFRIPLQFIFMLWTYFSAVRV